MNKCIFCNQKADTVIGIALGMSGEDFSLCFQCIKIEKIEALLKKAEDKIYGNQE